MRLVAAITPVAVSPSATDAGPISAEKYGKRYGKGDAQGNRTRVFAGDCDEILNKFHAASYRRKEARS